MLGENPSRPRKLFFVFSLFPVFFVFQDLYFQTCISSICISRTYIGARNRFSASRLISIPSPGPCGICTTPRWCSIGSISTS
jgi:hypothetical protein